MTAGIAGLGAGGREWLWETEVRAGGMGGNRTEAEVGKGRGVELPTSAAPPHHR